MFDREPCTKDNEDKNDVTTIRSPQKQTQPQIVHDRMFRTACLFVCFGMLGLASPLLGNTVVHLERLFDVNTATMSLTFTLNMAGYMTGSVVCALIYDRIDHELAFCVANLIQGLAIIIAPFAGIAGRLPAFIAVVFIQSVPQGFVDAAGQSYAVGLWMGHRLREPIVQAVCSMWSVGGMIGPLITALFLVELPSTAKMGLTSGETASVGCSAGFHDNCTHTEYATSTGSPLKSYDLHSTSSLLPVNSTADDDFVDVSRVRFAFVANGSMILFAGVMFAVAYFRGRSVRNHRTTVVDGKAEHIGDDLCSADPLKEQADLDCDSVETAPVGKKSLVDRLTYIMFCLLIFLFFTVYTYVELIPVQFITSFTVKYLGFPVYNASFLLSIFYGLHIAGNLIGVLVSAFLRPRTMMIANLLMTVVSFLLLIAFVNVWPQVIWISAAGSGLAMATTWATGVLWISDIIPVTGLVASIVVIGYSSSGMVAPMLVGYLFESSTPMWFVYIVFAASIIHVILFFGMLAYVSRFRRNLKKPDVVGRFEDSNKEIQLE